PKFDKHVKRTLIYLAIATAVSYFINVGFGNFMVLMIVFYLINHFFLLKVIDRFQGHTWPKFQAWYAKWLERAVRRPVTVLLGTLVLFVLAIVLMVVRGKTPVFFPSGDPNFAYVYITMPIGTDQATTNDVTRKIEQRVAKAVEPNKDMVTSIISNVTKGVTDPTDEDQGDYENKGKVTVAFVEFGKRNGKDTKQVLTAIRNAVQGVPGVKIAVAQENAGPPVQKDISIEIIGDNLDTLVKTGNRLKSYLAKQNIAGIENLVADVQNDKPEIVFDIDRTKEDDYQIKVRALQDQRGNIDEMRNMKITYRDMGSGGMIRQVPISAFTDVRYTDTYSNIKRKQQRRVITLGSSVIKPYNPNEVNANILRAVANFDKPDDVIIRQGGGQEDQLEAVTFLGGALATSFGLI
ncbi:MAG: efflux RND transporter permease subunit, partial [Sphingobacteriaceae bacterium]